MKQQDRCVADLPFQDHLLQAEAVWRDDRRLKRILKAARLKIPAAAEDIDYRPVEGWIAARSLN